MKIFGIKMGGKQSSASEEKEMQQSSSTMDDPQDTASSPIEVADSFSNEGDAALSKAEKKKLKEETKAAEKQAKAEAKAAEKQAKAEAKAAEKQAKEEAKAEKKKAKEEAKAQDDTEVPAKRVSRKDRKKSKKEDTTDAAGTEWKRQNKSKRSGMVPTNDELDDYMKDIDPDQVLKVLKQFAKEDSTDLVGKECVKALKRAEHVKKQDGERSQSTLGSKSPKTPRQTRTSRKSRGAVPSLATAKGGGLRRSQTETPVPRTKSKDKAARPAEV